MRLWIVLALAATAVAACAADALARSPFEGDARLDAPITAVIPMAPLSRVLRDVGAQCGVNLEPHEELRGECVTLIVRGRPAREVLQQLAASLDYTWDSVKGAEEARTYRLFEDGRARARRTQLRAEHRRESAAELERQLKLQGQFTEKFRTLTPKEVTAELTRLRETVNLLPTGRERFEAELASGAADAAANLESAGPRLAFAALPEVIRARLLDGERVVMTTGRPGTLPMPPEVLEVLRASRQYLAMRESRDAKPPVAQQSDDEVIDFLTYFFGETLTVRARSFRLGDVNQSPSWVAPKFLVSPSRVAVRSYWTRQFPGVLTADRPVDLKRRLRFSWAGKRLQPEDGLTYASGITLGEVVTRLSMEEPTFALVGDAPLRAITAVRKEENGVRELAPYETAEAFLARLSVAARGGSLTYQELFTGLGARGGSNIHVTADGWVRCRSTTFFNDREGHVDPDAIRTVFRPVAEEKPFTPEMGMEAGKTLSYAQVETLAADHLGFLPRLRPYGPFKHSIDGWRLLGELSSPALATLRAGAVLRYSSLGRRDRIAFDTFIRNRSLRPDGQPLDLALGWGALPKAVLLLTPPDAQGSRGLSVTLPGMKYPLGTTSLGAEWPRE